jgi:hypothetical protein
MWILVGVTARTNLKQAVRDANDGFACFPFQLCVPLTATFAFAVGSAASLRWWPSHHYVLFGIPVMLLLVICPIFDYFAVVLVSVMCLQIREFRAPKLSEITNVIHFPNLGGLLVGLTARLWLWLVGASAIALVGAIIRVVVRGPINSHAGGTSWRSWLVIHFILLLCCIAMSRYIFALPMMAIFRGAGMNYIKESISKAKPVLRLVVGIAVVEMVVCGLIPSLVRRIGQTHLVGRRPLELLLELIMLLASSCFSTWFVLLKTALTVQLVSPPQAEFH